MDVNSRKNSFLIVVGVGIIFAFILLYNTIISGEDNYVLEIQKMRKEKDESFKNSPSSPLPDSLKKDFKGLSYFDVNKKFSITSTFIPDPIRPRVETPQNDPTKNDFLTLAGKVKFMFDGEEYQLTAFLENERNSKLLFVPFRDATSGKETYGGGRYLEKIQLVNGKAVLDFNKAFHPLCVFNYSFVCPVPPPENTLPFAVTAGEKFAEGANPSH